MASKTAAKDGKTAVVLIQNETGQVKRVRVNGAEFDVVNAGPVVLPGEMGVSMTLSADVTFEFPEKK